MGTACQHCRTQSTRSIHRIFSICCRTLSTIGDVWALITICDNWATKTVVIIEIATSYALDACWCSRTKRTIINGTSNAKRTWTCWIISYLTSGASILCTLNTTTSSCKLSVKSAVSASIARIIKLIDLAFWFIPTESIKFDFIWIWRIIDTTCNIWISGYLKVKICFSEDWWWIVIINDLYT